MEANVYFFAALVSTGIFLLQFILSIFFGSMDTDIDVNADGNADIDMSSALHGILHLCGINDKGPGEREIMEAAENKALALISL